MLRTVLGVGLILSLGACPSGNDEREPVSVVLVGDDGGQPFAPALSPDGTRLAYAIPVNGRSAVFIAGADGSNPVRLTHGVWDDAPAWSPDGRWIAYDGESPNYDIFLVSTDGGESRQLTEGPANDGVAGWLPDGSGIVFYRRGVGDVQTLVVPIAEEPVRPLVPLVGGNQFVAISPDGSKAAFDLHRGGEGTIWVQDLAGGAPRQLTTEGMENADTRYVWSPDSRSLLYVSRRTGTWDLWVADVTTGDLRQLTSDVRDDYGARWSPDGQWVAFLSDRGGQTDVWMMPTAGGAARRVTRDRAFELWLQWSADGRHLTYSLSDGTSDVRVMAADSGAERVIAGFEGYQAGGAVLSPDGHTLLFNSDRSGNQDIWTVPFEGGEPTPFAASPLNDDDPRFSPDGSMVVFVSNRAGSTDLWIMPAAGGEARRLTDWPSLEAQPRWSPDGSMITFVSDRDASQGEVWIMPAAGGEGTRLTRGDAGAANPQWSADGLSILYVGSRTAGGSELYRVAVTGGAPQALAVGRGARVGSLELSPDGMHAAYSYFLDGWGYIEVVPTAGGTPRRLTTATEEVFQPGVMWSPDGTRLAVVNYFYPRDTYDVLMVTWPEGVWRSLTATPDVSEGGYAWTPDGRALIYGLARTSGGIRSVSVAELLGGQ